MIKDDCSSGGDDFKMEKLASKAEENETFGEYISDNSSTIFSVSVSGSGFSIGLASVLTSSSNSHFD